MKKAFKLSTVLGLSLLLVACGEASAPADTPAETDTTEVVEEEEIYEEDIEYVEYEVESDDDVSGEIKRKFEGDVEYKQIPYLDVMKDLKGRVGEFVELEGKVLQVSTDGDYLVVRLATELEDSEYLDNKYSYGDVYMLAIEKSSLEENIIEDEILSIKGIMAGFIEYTAVRGNLIKIPSVVVGSFDTLGYDS